MMNPKTIARPQLKSATQLTAMDLNNIHFDRRHTILTPELLSKVRSTRTAPDTDTA